MIIWSVTTWEVNLELLSWEFFVGAYATPLFHCKHDFTPKIGIPIIQFKPNRNLHSKKAPGFSRLYEVFVTLIHGLESFRSQTRAGTNAVTYASGGYLHKRVMEMAWATWIKNLKV